MRRPIEVQTLCAAALAVASTFALSACLPGQSDDTGGTTGWYPGDAAPDAGPDGGDGSTDDTDVIPDEPLQTTIRLENDGSIPVRVVPIGPCSDDSREWASLEHDGEKIRETSSCAVCDCDDLRNGGCAVCGAPACVEDPSTRPLSPGDHIEWTWSGQYFERDSVDGRSCERGVTPRRGETFTARICWYPPVLETGSDGSADSDLSARKCRTARFEYGESNVVRRITPGGPTKPHPTKFRLKNDTKETLYVRNRQSCRRTGKSWLQMYDRQIKLGGSPTEVDFTTDCSICSCSDLRSGECAACDLGCPPQKTVALKPGETKTLSWDGVGHRRESSEGRQCHTKWVPSKGRRLIAKFCWRAGARHNGRTCDRVSFGYGEDRSVTKVVEPDGSRSPSATEFVLRNESKKTVEVESFAHCRASHPDWLGLLRKGSPVDPGIECDECSCSQVRKHGRCSRICPAVACRGGTFELGPGEKANWKWPGYVAEQRTVQGKKCLEKTVPPTGSTFQARFCWKESSGGSTTRVCHMKRFVYGQDGRVVKRIQ